MFKSKKSEAGVEILALELSCVNLGRIFNFLCLCVLICKTGDNENGVTT
jgi:hypothetical protein